MDTSLTDQKLSGSLSLHWLGAPGIAVDGQPIRLETQKALALLAYLSLAGQPVPREALTAMFWPEFDQAHAFANLRRNLASLDKSLGRRWIEANRNTISLKNTETISIDILTYYDLIRRSREHCPASRPPCRECLRRLEEAVRLYRGEFLACLNFKDCNDFDEWQYFQREEAAQELAAALRRLAEGYASVGDMQKAIHYARRWLSMDLINEDAHRLLIQTYARAGQRGAALRQYEECRRVLWEELGQPPEPETTALVDKIFSTRSIPERPPAATPSAAVVYRPGLDPLPGTCSTLIMQRYRMAYFEPLD